VYFNPLDHSIAVALICRSCAEHFFNMGAYTLPLSSIEDQV